MTRKHIEKVIEIMALAIKITSETAHDVMCYYYGHVDCINVMIYPGGFDMNKDYSVHPDYIDMRIYSYKSDKEITEALDQCIDTLKSYESR